MLQATLHCKDAQGNWLEVSFSGIDLPTIQRAIKGCFAEFPELAETCQCLTVEEVSSLADFLAYQN